MTNELYNYELRILEMVYQHGNLGLEQSSVVDDDGYDFGLVFAQAT